MRFTCLIGQEEALPRVKEAMQRLMGSTIKPQSDLAAALGKKLNLDAEPARATGAVAAASAPMSGGAQSGGVAVAAAAAAVQIKTEPAAPPQPVSLVTGKPGADTAAPRPVLIDLSYDSDSPPSLTPRSHVPLPEALHRARECLSRLADLQQRLLEERVQLQRAVEELTASTTNALDTDVESLLKRAEDLAGQLAQ